jgi:DNA-binding SARP family transcriptional activator
VAPLRLELLGGFRVLTAGRPAARLPGVRQQQILGFLMLHGRSGPVARQRVAGSLWPDSTDAQALTNLRRELHHLNESFPELNALIDPGSRTLAWAHGDRAGVDVVEFEGAADRGLAGDRDALVDAVRAYAGDLMPDCSGEWVEAERERLRGRAATVLARLVGLLERDRAFAAAIEHAQHWCRLDPLNEEAWCALMRCHARRGDRATALHLYQQCAALLKRELGVAPGAATRMTYREILDLDAAATPVTPAPLSTFAYPLVGRSAEWRALLTAWKTAEDGRPGLALIRGEAGIGKSRLAEELVSWCAVQRIGTVTTRCYPGEGRLAYGPVAAWLKHEVLQPVLMKLDAAMLGEVARLHPQVLRDRSDVPVPDPQSETWQRVRFFESIAAVLRSAAPLVLVLDDVQWADADSLDWLHYFLRSAATSRCLVVATVRPEEESDNVPLGRLLTHLAHDGDLTVIGLGPLDREATAQLAGAVLDRPLDDTALVRTYEETEGHPLFIVERARMTLSGGDEGAPPGGAPSRVQSVVAARLHLLSPEARATAEVAAAVGRDFRFDLLAEASDLEEDVLVRALDELWRRHIVRAQEDERWDFSHDRIREVAYAGIGPARARLIHRRIAQGLERIFAGRLDEASATIAAHLERGGYPARAIPWLERAAETALRVSAVEEAIRCLTQALSMLSRLPGGPDRDAAELAIRSSLSTALNRARGYAAVEVEENFTRVLELTGAARGGPVPANWIWVAFTLRFMLGDLPGMRAITEQALGMAAVDPSLDCQAHHAMGGALQTSGDLEASRRHFDAAIAAYDEAHPRSALGTDLGVFARAWGAHTLWLLGDEPAALAQVAEALALARRRDPFAETLALAYAALLHQMRRDVDGVIECASAVVALCDRYGFAYYGDWARALLGWAHGQTAPPDGAAAIEAALGRLDAQRAQARRPYYLSLLAELQLAAGDQAKGTATIDAAIALALRRQETWWLPALYLQQGLLASDTARDAALARALDLARAQHNRAIEQRIHSVPGSGTLNPELEP